MALLKYKWSWLVSLQLGFNQFFTKCTKSKLTETACRSRLSVIIVWTRDRSLECACTNFTKLTVHLSISCQCVSVIKSNLISYFWSKVKRTSVEMAEPATEIPINIQESVIEAVKNVTDKPPSSIEGIAIAYLSIVIMAILPIFFGSFRSVKYLKERKVSTSTTCLYKNMLWARILGLSDF